MLKLNYRFQLDGSSFQASRHELTTSSRFGSAGLSARYFYVDEVEGTGFTENREQISGSAFYDLTDAWRVRTFGTYDFADDVDGLLRAVFPL